MRRKATECVACGGALVLDVDGPHEYVCVDCGAGVGEPTPDDVLIVNRAGNPVARMEVERPGDDD